MKLKICMMMLLIGTLVQKVNGQSQEVQQLLLNVEKLAQFKQILTDMKKGYQVVSTGYSTISELSKGNFNLHKTFLDRLMEVSPMVKKYKRISEIINYQIILVKTYKTAFSNFKSSGNFTAKELQYTSIVYKRLLNESLVNLEDLITVITAGQLKMSDNERLTEIDRIYLEMENKLDFLRQFNSDNSILGLQRAKEQKDINSIQKYYQ